MPIVGEEQPPVQGYETDLYCDAALVPVVGEEQPSVQGYETDLYCKADLLHAACSC